MSRKVQQFASIITQPLNIYNFEVIIPGFPDAIIITSTDFPAEKLRVVEKWFKGEKIRYQSIPENGGTWKFKIPENDGGTIKKQLDKFKSKAWNQTTGLLVPIMWNNVQVYSRDLADNNVFGVVLHGCWLQDRGSVGLDSGKPDGSWDWEYEFVYQWLEDIDFDKTGSPDPSTNSQ